MKPLLVAVAAMLCAATAGAQVDVRGYVGFEAHDVAGIETQGLRQNLDLGVLRPLTSTMSLRLRLRADDFRGTSTLPLGTQDSASFQLQPGAQFSINAENLQMNLVGDLFANRYTRDDIQTETSIERMVASLAYTPTAALSMSVTGQRLATHDDQSGQAINEEFAMGRASYGWRGLQVGLTERYARTGDGFLDRTSFSHGASLDFTHTAFSDKLAINASASADVIDVRENIVDGANEVSVPVVLARGLFAVDDTPSDNRDHPLAPYPGLTDGLLETGTGISVGPNSVSFQNLAVDLGRYDEVDELRIHVRDDTGNPLRLGGGAVTWDVWTSTDGLVWTLASGVVATFNRTLSRYEVRFDEKVARWFKAVNFGVNSNATNVTEIQAYHREVVETRAARKGIDQNVSGFANVQFRPVRRLQFAYTGMYAGTDRDYESETVSQSTLLQHSAAVEYQVLRTLVARAEFGTMENDSGRNLLGMETSDTMTGSLTYSPTSRLRFMGEVNRQSQILIGRPVDTEGVRLRVDAVVYRSLSFGAGVGREQQTTASGEPASRTFAELTANARLTRSLRLSLAGTLQQVDSTGGEFVQLLGASRDNRISAELTWHPSDQLLLSGRMGWLSGTTRSGFTHRLRGEWYPFPGGSLLLGGSYDQDIDPLLDRRATRAVFNPRWLINRWAAFDLNYTSITNSAGSNSIVNRSLLATLILTR